MHLQIQACIPLGCREMPASATASSPGAPEWAGVGSPQPQAQLHSQTSPSPTTPQICEHADETHFISLLIFR